MCVLHMIYLSRRGMPSSRHASFALSVFVNIDRVKIEHPLAACKYLVARFCLFTSQKLKFDLNGVLDSFRAVQLLDDSPASLDGVK